MDIISESALTLCGKTEQLLSDVNKTTKFKTKTKTKEGKTKTKTRNSKTNQDQAADETYIKTQIIAPTMAINRWETGILTNSSKLSQIVETISYYLIEHYSLIKL